MVQGRPKTHGHKVSLERNQFRLMFLFYGDFREFGGQQQRIVSPHGLSGGGGSPERTALRVNSLLSGRFTDCFPQIDVGEGLGVELVPLPG